MRPTQLRSGPVAARTESVVVNAAGLVQGIVLVTFPAASTIFTAKAHYGLSNSQYGAMFLPQVAMAIAASLLGAGLARRIGAKQVYLLGLAASLASMGLLIASTTVQSDQSVGYPLLLIATAFLGAGFGLTVPVLNTYASVFHPDRVDRSVLVLNALLGLGTVLAPVFVAVFVGLGFWWGLPVLSVTLLTVLLLVSARLPLRAGPRAGPGTRQDLGTRAGIPLRFWCYAIFAVLYGICETMNGNWSQLVMTTRLGASATQASLALTAFWGMVTVGRVMFSATGRWLPDRVTYHILPLILVASFLLIDVLPRHAAAAGIAVFGLAGLGCSALLPLTISFGEEDLTSMSAAMAGRVIAFYQLGYGLAAFGVGPLEKTGLSLSAIFDATAILAAVLALVSFAVTHGMRRPDHPARMMRRRTRPRTVSEHPGRSRAASARPEE
jgi:MFS family permease